MRYVAPLVFGLLMLVLLYPTVWLVLDDIVARKKRRDREKENA